MWQIISKGGICIYPLLLCSILAIAIIIERFISLRRIRRVLLEFFTRLDNAVRNRSLTDALKTCAETENPLAKIYENGLLALQGSQSSGAIDREQIRSVFQESACLELPLLDKYIGILATIAYISPLLGFLGTVTGMIKAFRRIQDLAQQGQAIGPGDLAGGIWEALITTAVGLVIAIPVYLAYSYFRGYIRKLIEMMEKTAVELTNVFLP